MRVQATKTMAKAIQDFLKGNKTFNGYKITCEKLFDFWQGEKNVIKVVYPYNYYALPNYLDDSDLMRIYRQCDKTFDGFMKAVLDEIEV